ncbi:MAG: DUF1573 domain-containing protein, partial [Planctomycetes bacterium]|nr:DUF1573 domain-containing protein [Planctomycetota bacterium]
MHVQFFAWSVLALAIGANGSEPEPDLRCGSYSLYIALSGMDLIHESFEAFEDRIGPPSAKGYSFGQLDAVAKSVSAHSLGVSTNLDNLRARTGQFACLALINDIHIVNVIFVTESEVTIIDAPRSYRIPNDTFLSQWDGTALLVSTSQLIPEEDLGKGRSSWAYVACGGGVVIAALFLLARRQSRVKKMRNVLAATVLVLLGCGSNDASTTIPVENVGPPRIFFEETEKNCGEVPAENKSFVVSFAFQNKGYTDLKINRIEKSCTCTTVSTNGERFPPGTSGRVNATVETGVPGSRSIALFIHTNDPLQPIIRLEAKYSAITVLRFEPDTLDFGVLRPNSEAERRVRLLRKSTGDDGDCKIEDIAGDISQRIKVAIEGATK